MMHLRLCFFKHFLFHFCNVGFRDYVTQRETIHVGAAASDEGVHLAVNSYDNGNRTFSLSSLVRFIFENAFVP